MIWWHLCYRYKKIAEALYPPSALFPIKRKTCIVNAIMQKWNRDAIVN